MKILRRARARSKFSEKFAPFIRASKFSHSFFKFQTRKFSAQTFTSRTYCAALKNAFVLAESKTCALLSSLAPQKSLAGLLLPPPLPPRGLLLLVFSPTFAATFAARQHKYAKKGLEEAQQQRQQRTTRSRYPRAVDLHLPPRRRPRAPSVG